MARRGGRQLHAGFCNGHLVVAMGKDGDILIQMCGVSMGKNGSLTQTGADTHLPHAVVTVGRRIVVVGIRHLRNQPFGIGGEVPPVHKSTVFSIFVRGVTRRRKAGGSTVPVVIRGSYRTRSIHDGGRGQDGRAVALRHCHIAKARHHASTLHGSTLSHLEVYTVVEHQQRVLHAAHFGVYHLEVRAGGGAVFTGRIARILAQVLYRHGVSTAVDQQGFLIEVHSRHIVHTGIKFQHIVAAEVETCDVVQRIRIAVVGRGGIGGTGQLHSRVVERQTVASLHRLQLPRGMTVDGRTVVPDVYLFTTHHIAAIHRGTRTEHTLHNVHLRQNVQLVVVGIVVFAVDAHLAFAAEESWRRKVGSTLSTAPVRTGIDTVVQQQLVGHKGWREASRGAGLEFPIGAGGTSHAAILISLAIGHTTVNGVRTNVDIHRTVRQSQIAGTIQVALYLATRDVQDGGRTLGGGTAADTLVRVAVVDALRTTIDRFRHLAAVHVEHFEAIDQRGFVVPRTAGAGEDVVVEHTSMDIGDDVAVVQGVTMRSRVGQRGVGDLMSSHHHILSRGIFLVGEGSAQFSTTIEVAVHFTIVEGKVYVFVIRSSLGGAVASRRIVTIAGTIDIVEVARIDGDVALVDVAREVVAAEEAPHIVLVRTHIPAVQGHMGRAEDIGSPTATIKVLKGLLPAVMNSDIGVHHVTTTTATIGFGRANQVGMMELHMRGFCDVTVTVAMQVAFVQMFPVSHTTTEDGSGDGEVAIAASHRVVHHHTGGATLSHGATTIHATIGGAYSATPEIQTCTINVGTSSGSDKFANSVHAGDRAEGVNIIEVVANLHEVVTAVGTTEEVMHRTATDVDTGDARDVARDVIATKDIVHTRTLGVSHLHIGGAFHITHAITTKDCVEHCNMRTLQHHMRGDVRHHIAQHVGEIFLGAHHTVVSAAKNGVHHSLRQADVRHHIQHVVDIVAAEDGTHGMDCIRGVVQQHDDLVFYADTIAASEDSSNGTAGSMDINEGGRLFRGDVARGVGAMRDAFILRTAAIIVIGSVTRTINATNLGSIFHTQVGRYIGVPGAGVGVEFCAVGGHHLSVCFRQCLFLTLAGSNGSIIVVSVDIGTEGTDGARAVVATEEGTINLDIAAQCEVGQTVDVRLESTTEGVVDHPSATGHEVYGAFLRAAHAGEADGNLHTLSIGGGRRVGV